jgi:hypothetical protein
LRDRSGRRLATYPFTPQWRIEENQVRHAVFVDLEVPERADVSTMAIQLNGKTLAEQNVSPAPPTLTVNPLRTGPIADKTVQVRWQGSTSNGAKPVFSVLYSPNGGIWFTAQLFESPVTQFNVTLDPRTKDHLIKLVVTDGTRSSEQTVAFHST